jgi:hypothetical protein
MQHSPICIDSDSDDDCGYTGGVNLHLDSEQELEDTDESDKWSDTESLSELEGEELEENLQALRPKLPVTSPEEVTMLYEEIRGGKSAKTQMQKKSVDWGIMDCQSIQNSCVRRRHKTGPPCMSGHEIHECNW